MSSLLRTQLRCRTIRPTIAAIRPATSALSALQARTITNHTPRIAEQSFTQIKSNVDTSSQDFRDNAKAMGELTTELRALHAKISLGGNEKARKKHLERKKMLPREYVSTVCVLSCRRRCEASSHVVERCPAS
jgi:hypothetical protein